MKNRRTNARRFLIDLYKKETKERDAGTSVPHRVLRKAIASGVTLGKRQQAEVVRQIELVPDELCEGPREGELLAKLWPIAIFINSCRRR